MENKTAEDFLKPTRGYMGSIPAYTEEQVMIRFAKYHVQKALEAASKNVKTYTDTSGSTDEWTTEVDKGSILNSYPPENIK